MYPQAAAAAAALAAGTGQCTLRLLLLLLLLSNVSQLPAYQLLDLVAPAPQGPVLGWLATCKAQGALWQLRLLEGDAQRLGACCVCCGAALLYILLNLCVGVVRVGGVRVEGGFDKAAATVEGMCYSTLIGALLLAASAVVLRLDGQQ